MKRPSMKCTSIKCTSDQVCLHPSAPSIKCNLDQVHFDQVQPINFGQLHLIKSVRSSGLVPLNIRGSNILIAIGLPLDSVACTQYRIVGRYVRSTVHILQTAGGPGSNPPPQKSTCSFRYIKDLEVVPTPKMLSSINI